LQRLSTANEHAQVQRCKARARAVIETFNRLDLLLTIEFSASDEIAPLITDVTNLPTALGLC
uniref:DUF58 domain-containing protein n=1 Tax=Gongylonema pulchrum TaxID=637853 RepID=A0A183F0V7_9BILA